MQISDIDTFIQVVESGSVSRAAKLLGRPKASVSHNIRRLETNLGAEVFDRSQNTLELNEAGLRFLAHAKGIKEHYEQARDAAQIIKQGHDGTLRIASTSEFASNIMSGIFMNFANDTADLSLQAMTHPREILAEIRHQYDVIIYLGAPEMPEFSEMKQRRLGQFRYQLYAAPAYLDTAGGIAAIDDLQDHRLLVQTNYAHLEQWSLSKAGQKTSIKPVPTFASNDPWIVKLAAVHGHGISFLPEFFARQEQKNGMLVQVLEGWASDAIDVNALYWAHRFANPNLSLVLEKAARSFGDIDHYLYRASKPE